MKKALEKEYKKTCMDEIDYLVTAARRNPTELESLAARFIPESLDTKLSEAFAKAFEVIFEKGTGIISATVYDKELDTAQEAIIRSKIAGLFDTAVSFAEGAGMGFIGLGLPDIPVFTAMVFRNIYQKAAFYGFGYEDECEKLYMLKLIETALTSGREIEALNEEIDRLAVRIDQEGESLQVSEEDIKAASNALADDMLYIKFVQGIPLVGTVGGLFNAATIRKINKYAEIKYHKRSLLAGL